MNFLFPTNDHLRLYLKQGGYPELAGERGFGLDLGEYERALEELKRQHPSLGLEEAAARAAYRLLAKSKPASKVAEGRAAEAPTTGHHQGLWRALIIAWAVAVLFLLAAIAAKAEPGPGADRLAGPSHEQWRANLVRASLRASLPPAVDVPIIFLENQLSQLAVIPAGLVRLNCSTNMSCTWDSANRRFNITSSATAGTAWSSLTAPTANLSMSHGAFTTTFTYGAATGAGVDLFNFADTLNNTGTGHLVKVNTASGSAAKPVQFSANGNGVEMSTTGVLAAIGTGGINATQCNGVACMSNPMTTAGDVIYGGVAGAPTRLAAGTTTQLFHSGATPSWSAVSLASDITGTLAVGNGGTGLTTITSNQLIAGRGTAAPVSVPSGTAGQLLTSNGAGTDPSFQDPVVSGATASASDTLTAAGFSTSVSLSGGAGAVMRLTFGGTITALDVRAQVSSDGGTNFQDVDTYNISSEVVQLSITSATAADYSIYVPAGATHVRANVVTLTGTTPSITIATRTSYVANPRTHTAFDRVPGSSDPSHALSLGASDGTNLQRLRAATAAPAGTEQGLIVRNIPSGTQTVGGTVTANAGTGTLATDPIDRAVRLVGQVEGRAASGAAKAGNPNQIGYVFNTTQPTVTTGQAVEAQGTARGAAIVATGVDTFNVTVNAALPTGANVIGALSANQSVNVAQVAGTATGTAAAGVQKVGVVGNAGAAVDAALAAAAPANAVQIAGKDLAGNTQTFIVDPCMDGSLARSSTNINQTAGAQLVTGAASKQTYICTLNLISATAQNVALVEGTGTVCATGIAGMAGGTTAATGWNLAANGGLVSNGAGYFVFKTATAADNVCLLQSGTGQVSGNVTWVQK